MVSTPAITCNRSLNAIRGVRCPSKTVWPSETCNCSVCARTMGRLRPHMPTIPAGDDKPCHHTNPPCTSKRPSST